MLALTILLVTLAADTPEPCHAVIQQHQGAPAIFINGEPVLPLAYLMHAGDRDKQYKQMADIGVNVFSVSAGIGLTPEGQDFTGCELPFTQVLKHQPEAFIFPRIGVTPPAWWLDAHPEERVVFDDGTTGPQSMFSERWLADACLWVENYSRYLRTSPFADHVLGIHICSGETAEWQSWGLWDNKRGDFSPPAQRAWKAYLKAKYGTDAALQAAWGQEKISLDTISIPSRARRETENEMLRDPVAFQDVMDFYDYYWRGTAKAIQELAAAAKRGGGRDWLVGVFYGYAIQYGGKMMESQHLGMKEVMDSPDIDFFCSPAMYSLRMPGGTSTFMSFTDSIKMRNKIWWDEADNRTHLAIGRQFGEVNPAQNLAESLDVLEREFAHCFSRKTPLWLFDMAGGWYDDPAILARLQEMRTLADTHTAQWEPPVEIAVFIDDKSAYRMAPESTYLHEVRDFMAALPRLGAPYHTYLLSDLPKVPEYKAYLFPLAFDLTPDERSAINALKREDTLLIFMGEAGIGTLEEGRVTEDMRNHYTLIGLPSVSTEHLLANPPELMEEGLSYMDECKAAVFASPTVPFDRLRSILRTMGKVHLYHQEDDAFYAGNGFIALHAQKNGTKTITFPEPVAILEIFNTDTHVETITNILKVDLKSKETRSFTISPRDTTELIQDPKFRKGFNIYAPEQGAHVLQGKLRWFPGNEEPIWGIAQWDSKYSLADHKLEQFPEKFTYQCSDPAKKVAYSTKDILTLAMDSRKEWIDGPRKQGEAWPHLLASQSLLNPPRLNTLNAMPFRVECRINRAETFKQEDYSESLHAAQYQIFFTVQNRNKNNPGYGDFLWLGVSVYDDRGRTEGSVIKGDIAHSKLIYTPHVPHIPISPSS